MKIKTILRMGINKTAASAKCQKSLQINGLWSIMTRAHLWWRRWEFFILILSDFD
nr:MAG TPA: hypothetical protein [Caudoviricetes sp.]